MLGISPTRLNRSLKVCIDNAGTQARTGRVRSAFHVNGVIWFISEKLVGLEHRDKLLDKYAC